LTPIFNFEVHGAHVDQENRRISWAQVAHIYNSSYVGGRDQEDMVQGQPWQIVRPCLENTQHKKQTGGVAQKIEHLPSKHEALKILLFKAALTQDSISPVPG
jgi:hypothetical protein